VFTKFIKIRDINTICLPGQAWAGDGSGNPVIDAAIGHASKMKSRMVIVDPPADKELETPKQVIDLSLPSKTYSVLYYPWVHVANPFYNAEKNPGAPKKVLVPPSGYAAGMWARIDGKRGVWKAPAGLESGLLGVAGLQYVVEDGEQDSLNPLGVNCLRKMPGAGPVIWGARTLATKADPEWRYVPVRRTAIMIEQSIYEGIQWAVFEPNDHRLWSSLRGNIGGFMNSLFRVGAFQGEKASDAYFVRCGLGDTMTQAEIDAGQVIVIVGFAPLKPAEFVIVRIQQKVNLQ
jgi:phage tail sheath protein FI